MKENNAKDLIALSCIAYQQQDFKNASYLFALAMSNADSEDFIDSLLEDNYTGKVLAQSLAYSTPEGDLNSISSTMAEIMEENHKVLRRGALRSDDEDAIDFSSQLFDDGDIETVSNSAPKAIKSPLSLKLK